MGTQYGKGTSYLELLEFGEHARAQGVYACLGVPGELNALSFVRSSSSMSIAVVSAESRVDRSCVFRGALTVTKVHNLW